MTPRLGVALLAGFGSMMVLTGILGFSQMRRTAEMQRGLLSAQDSYMRTETLLSQMRADLYRINLDIRDFLLDRDTEDSAEVKEQVLQTRTRILSSLDELGKLMEHTGDVKPVKELRERVETFFTMLQPPLEWSPEVKIALGGGYTRKVLLSRRGEIGALAERMEGINLANLRVAQQKLLDSQGEFQKWLRGMTYMVLFLSGLVALVSVWWIFRLEGRARAAKGELRNLSQMLVRAQEEERKRLSLELHDQVGQMLTALRVEISNLGRIGSGDPERFQTHVRQAKEVAEGAMKTVRDLAMGLRPSMLDDLGLGAAVGWLGRDFSRRSGVPADVQIEGALDTLSEAQKTGLFRVVQEALTNITRHASAQQVSVKLSANDDRVELTVQDDGKGMHNGVGRRGGMGLLGMEERIRELSGDFEIESSPGKGTRLRARIPTKVSKNT